MISRSPEQDAAFRQWVDRAKRAPIETVLRRLGAKPQVDNKGGPCPCPSCVSANRVSDRFSINRRKNLFFCRASGEGGGPIGLVMHVQGSAFVDAVEYVTGDAAPNNVQRETDTERAARLAKLEAETRAAEERARDAADKNEVYRDRERARAFALWKRAAPIDGTLTQRYLAQRGLALPANANLRHLDTSDFWDKPKTQGGRIIHSGPAMAAAITAADGSFMGLHRTWIDLAQPKGKAIVPNAETGEMLPAKKVRGSHRGGAIFLGGASRADTRRVFMGEGIETTGSAYCALKDFEAPLLAGARFQAAVSLGNIGGRAAKSVPHPTLRFADKRGRVKPVRVPGPEPSPDDRATVIGLPERCDELYLIQDGDSEPFFTSNCMLRGAARFSRERPDLAVLLIRAADGLDLNDMRLAILRATAGESGEVAA